MSVKLKDYRGVAIYVREDGRFTADVVHDGARRADTVVTKDLKAVEQAIDAAIPKRGAVEPIRVLRAEKATKDLYRRGLEVIKTPDTDTIVGIKRIQEGRGKNAYVRTQLINAEGEQTYEHSMYLDDEAVRDEMAAIVAEAARLLDRWNAAVDRLTPITKDEIVARVDALDAAT